MMSSNDIVCERTTVLDAMQPHRLMDKVSTIARRIILLLRTPGCRLLPGPDYTVDQDVSGIDHPISAPAALAGDGRRRSPQAVREGGTSAVGPVPFEVIGSGYLRGP